MGGNLSAIEILNTVEKHEWTIKKKKKKKLFALSLEFGNDIYVSISMNGSDTPVTRPETDKAGQSSRERMMGGGKFKCY